MLITGLEGPITIASAARSALSTSAVGLASSIPSSSTPCTSGLPAVEDQVLLQPAPAGGGQNLGTDRAVAHRQHPGRDPEPRCDLGLGIGGAAARREELAAVEAGGEVAIGEAEPVRRTDLRHPLDDGEAVVAQPPAALLVDFTARASR